MVPYRREGGGHPGCWQYGGADRELEAWSSANLGIGCPCQIVSEFLLEWRLRIEQHQCGRQRHSQRFCILPRWKVHGLRNGSGSDLFTNVLMGNSGGASSLYFLSHITHLVACFGNRIELWDLKAPTELPTDVTSFQNSDRSMGFALLNVIRGLLGLFHRHDDG
jgi:hypothetical protein